MDTVGGEAELNKQAWGGARTHIQILVRAPPVPSSPYSQTASHFLGIPTICLFQRAGSGRTLGENVAWGQSLGRLPVGVGGLRLLPYTHSDKPWSGPLKKEATGQS